MAHCSNISRGHRLEFANKDICSSLKIFFISANSADTYEMRILRHFIWVFTVCQAPVNVFPVSKGLKCQTEAMSPS